MLEVVFNDSTKAGFVEVIKEGSFEDVVQIGFHLEIGNILNKEACSNRKDTLSFLWNRFDFQEEEKQRYLSSLQDDEKKLLAYASNNKPIRLWVSQTDYSQCGLRYVCYLLKDLECKLSIIELPTYIESGNHCTSYFDWCEVPIHQYVSFLPYEKKLDKMIYTSQWIELMNENAPLRAYLNGQLVSVNDDFYDSLIRYYLPDGEFSMAYLIGTMLGKYSIRINDAFIASRLEYMIAHNELEIIKTKPPYHHIIKKKLL